MMKKLGTIALAAAIATTSTSVQAKADFSLSNNKAMYSLSGATLTFGAAAAGLEFYARKLKKQIEAANSIDAAGNVVRGAADTAALQARYKLVNIGAKTMMGLTALSGLGLGIHASARFLGQSKIEATAKAIAAWNEQQDANYDHEKAVKDAQNAHKATYGENEAANKQAIETWKQAKADYDTKLATWNKDHKAKFDKVVAEQAAWDTKKAAHNEALAAWNKAKAKAVAVKKAWDTDTNRGNEVEITYGDVTEKVAIPTKQPADYDVTQPTFTDARPQDYATAAPVVPGDEPAAWVEFTAPVKMDEAPGTAIGRLVSALAGNGWLEKAVAKKAAANSGN